MSISQKKGLRVLALPLTRPRPNGRPPFVFYHVQSPPEPPSKNPHMFRRAMDKAMTTWTGFGKQDKTSWKYKLYAWGERAADRVEFEETSLKAVNTSFKPNAEKPEFDLGPLEHKAKFLYPSVFGNSLDAWKAHLIEREPYHRRYFYLWTLGLPISAPIGLAPIIPNIPFYFCGWRAWSHWKAWGATTYLNQLINLQYFEPATDLTLDRIYGSASAMAKGPISIPSNPPKLSVTEPTSDTTREKTAPSSSIDDEPLIDTQLILHPADVPIITSSFNLSPSIGAELLRAIDQSRVRLKKELKESQELVK